MALTHSPQFVASNLQRHVYVVSKEQSCAKALRHGYGRAINVRGKLGDCVKPDVALKSACYPRAYATFLCKVYPFARASHAPMQPDEFAKAIQAVMKTDNNEKK